MAVGVLVGMASAARAGGIVLESYVGARPDDAGELVHPLLDELGTRGFVSGFTAVGSKFESEVSRPAIVQQGLPLDFADQVERGHRAWVGGRFEEAVRTLTPLVELAHANPGALLDVTDHAQRDRLLKAMIALAISQQRLAELPAAKATLSEVLRSFPDAAIAKSAYGPDAAALFDEVKREAGAAGRGRLIVHTGDSTAVVFVDEHVENIGSVNKGDLYAGEYRVLIQVGPMVSRSHRAIVRPGEDTTIDIDLAFDQSIHTARAWTGLTFASTADRDRLEAPYAAQLAKAIGARSVAVVGIDETRGKPTLVGALIALATQRESRRASLALEPPPPPGRVRALARFLGGDGPEKGLDVQLDGAGPPSGALTPPPAPPRDLAVAPGGTWGGWKWITGATAVGALVAGGVLLHYDGKCSQAVGCGNVYNTAAPGWIAIGGGAALAIVTVYLVLHGHGTYVAPAPGGATVGYATSF